MLSSTMARSPVRLIAMMLVAQMSSGSRADGQAIQIQTEPTRTAKERLSGKAGEQRVERQYRRDVVTRARLAGSQSASRTWLWPPALGDSIMPGAGRQTTSAGHAAAASPGSHCTISGVVSSDGHPRPGRKAWATAVIAESIFDLQGTFERRSKIWRNCRFGDRPRRHGAQGAERRGLQVRATPAGSASCCTELLIIQSRMAQSIRILSIAPTDSHCP